MKISGTRSTIIFNMEDGHIMYANGELLLNKSFVVDKKTMQSWEPPYENEIVTIETVNNIIQEVENMSDHDTMKIIFL